jgi:hypothetical protein
MNQFYIELNQKLNHLLDPAIEQENEFIAEMMDYFNGLVEHWEYWKEYEEKCWCVK